MSIHHEVTVHCDGCGTWEHGDERSARQRRKAGWRIWKDQGDHWRHLCPDCTVTVDGERPPSGS